MKGSQTTVVMGSELWLQLFPWVEGLGCFDQFRFSLTTHYRWTHAAAAPSATVFIASLSTPSPTNFMKISGIRGGIKERNLGTRVRWAGSPSGGLRQQLLVSLGFKEACGRRALVEPKCCCKLDLSPRTGRPCFLIFLTTQILLPNVPAICQQLQKLMHRHLCPPGTPNGEAGRRAEAVSGLGAEEAKRAVPSSSGGFSLGSAPKDRTPAHLTSSTNVKMGIKKSDRKWVSRRT